MFARHFVHVRDVLFEFWLLHVAITCATRYKQWNLFCSELFEKQFLGIWNYSFISLNHHFTQLFEDRLALVNPRLNCNPGFYFFFWRVFSRIIFSILFRAIHSYIVDWRNQLNWILLFTLSYLNSNVELTLGYLKPALKNPADSSSEHIGRCAVDGTVSAGNARKTSKILTRKNWTIRANKTKPTTLIYIIFFASILHDWQCKNRCPLQQRSFRCNTSVFSSKRLCYNKSLYKVVGTISEGCLHTNCHTFLYQKINAYQESFSLFGYVCGT